MSRPANIPINNGENGWDADLNDNLVQLYDRPAPIGELYAGTKTALTSARAPGSYAQCMVWAYFGSSSAYGTVPFLSDGSAYYPLASWKWQRKPLTLSVTTTYNVLDADELVVTGNGTFAINLPALSEANDGREIRIKFNGTGTKTVTADGSDTIDGSGTFAVSTPYTAYTFVANFAATEWMIF